MKTNPNQLSFPDPDSEPLSVEVSAPIHPHLPEPDWTEQITPLAPGTDPNEIGVSERYEDEMGAGIADARQGELRTTLTEKDFSPLPIAQVGDYDPYRKRPVYTDEDARVLNSRRRFERDKKIQKAGRSIGQTIVAEEGMASLRDNLDLKAAAKKRTDELRESLAHPNKIQGTDTQHN